MKTDTLHLIHIRECIDRINSYIDGIDKNQFMSSSLIQDAVLRNLQVMAESTQRLSDDFKIQHAEMIQKLSITDENTPDYRKQLSDVSVELSNNKLMLSQLEKRFNNVTQEKKDLQAKIMVSSNPQWQTKSKSF